MISDLTISIIIPVYKVEQYLSQCVDSVLKQSYQNLEVILVNDGSPDTSPNLCNQYRLKDSRIKVIHKINGGLSSARNSGLEQATGEYVLFLDGDDFWDDSEALQHLVDRIALTNPDVLNFSYSKFIEGEGKSSSYFGDTVAMPATLSSRSEQLQYLTEHNLFIASACNKMIRRTLFNDNLFFEKGVFSEDIEWTARLMTKAHSFDFIPDSFYCYRQRPGSISHSISLKNCQDIQHHIVRCVQLADNSDVDVKNALYHFTAFQLGAYIKIQAMAEDAPKDCIKSLAPYQWLLRYHGTNRKLKILYLLNHILPFPAMCNLFRMIYGKRH